MGEETLLVSESAEAVSLAEDVVSAEFPLPATEFLEDPSTYEMVETLQGVEPEPALSTLTEDSGGVDRVRAAARIERSVPEVLSSWLDAIRRRRAAHV